MELDRATVDRVLRRASDMSAARPPVSDSHGRMSEAVLLEAAAEAGIDPDAVRMSLAVERLGALPDSRRLDGTVGPREVTVDRVVALDVDTLLGRIDDLLQRQHGLRRSRSGGEWGEWRKRTDAMGAVHRLARTGSGAANLRNLGRVEARTSAIDRGHTMVRLIADRSSERNEALAGGAAIGGLGLAATGMFSVMVTPFIAAAAPIAVVAGVATARTGRKQQRDLVADVESLLDAVERGIRPVTLTDDVRRVLRQLRS